MSTVSREKFEEYFLGLNHEFTRDDLSTTNMDNERYFYTTTQALWVQWQKIAELQEAIESMRGDG
jgi:hypothetical protein